MNCPSRRWVENCVRCTRTWRRNESTLRHLETAGRARPFMTRAVQPDLLADPFAERTPQSLHEELHLLGGRFRFETDNRQLLRLVQSAYAGLPRLKLPASAPRFRIKLVLTSGERRRA